MQVDPRLLPVALNGALRDAHHRRDLREREPAKEFQVDDPRQAGVVGLELVERVADPRQLVSVGRSLGDVVESDVISNSPPRFCAWRRARSR